MLGTPRSSRGKLSTQREHEQLLCDCFLNRKCELDTHEKIERKPSVIHFPCSLQSHRAESVLRTHSRHQNQHHMTIINIQGTPELSEASEVLIKIPISSTINRRYPKSEQKFQYLKHSAHKPTSKLAAESIFDQ